MHGGYSGTEMKTTRNHRQGGEPGESDQEIHFPRRCDQLSMCMDFAARTGVHLLSPADVILRSAVTTPFRPILWILAAAAPDAREF